MILRAFRRRSAFRRVLQSGGEKFPDVIVGETVVHCLALASARDEAGGSKKSELMADRGLAHLQNRAQVHDAEFAGRKRAQDPQPARVREHFEKIDRFGKKLIRNCGGPGGLHAEFMVEITAG